MSLTNYKIDSLKPKEKIYQVADSGGLVLDVLPTGKKVWRYRYRITGQKTQEKITIGAYPEIGLADARIKKAELQKQVQQGISPAKAKQQKKTAIFESDTVSDFCKIWLEKILIPNKKNARNDEAIFNNDVFPAIGDRKIQDITRADIFGIIDSIKDRGANTRALLARALLIRVFDYAVLRDKISLNPVKAIKASDIGKINHRDNVLSKAEISHFINAVYDSNMTHSNKLALHLILICMVRKKELMFSTWDEIDLDTGIWIIPSNRMKKRKDHLVYLPRQAIAIFSELKQLAGNSAYVLPSMYSEEKPISNNLLNLAVYKLKLPFDFVLHDFRRTASSHLHDAGFNSDVIEKALAHDQKGTRAIYNRAEYAEQRRELLQAWASFIESLMTDNKVILGNFRKTA